jgi:hypothetical protein
MLSSKSPSRAYCEPLKRIARWVAIALVGAMSIGASPIEDALIDANPKAYIRSIYSKDKALCLIKLYGKESAFNRYAIGNRLGKKQAYGIPQLKNPAVAHVSSIEQVNMGIDYIEHRYHGDTCMAYAHYLRKGWH